jgi:urease accessory protein
MNLLSLARLLQLSSPALPVGAYSYSQGLEWVVEQGIVTNEKTASQWIEQVLQQNIALFEAPWLVRLMAAWDAMDRELLTALNEDYMASRETGELRAETLQMGYSMTKLLEDMPDFPKVFCKPLKAMGQVSFPVAWSCAATAWKIDMQESLTAYLWAWLENQVMAAVKGVPLGQTAGQKILMDLGGLLPELVQQAMTLDDAMISNFAPGFAIASSRHEMQYTRLYRS